MYLFQQNCITAEHSKLLIFNDKQIFP